MTDRRPKRAKHALPDGTCSVFYWTDRRDIELALGAQFDDSLDNGFLLFSCLYAEPTWVSRLADVPVVFVDPATGMIRWYANERDARMSRRRP